MAGLTPSACPWSCPRAPGRIPGRLSVAPTGSEQGLRDVHLECLLAFRILAGACLSSRRSVRRTRSACARRRRYSCARRTAVSAPVRKRPRIRQRPSLSARRQFRRHSLESHRNCGPLALVSRAYGEILETRPSVRLRRRGAFARFAVPQDRYPKAVLMPIRELMTSPSEKSTWKNRRS